jgi:hypothetical protein
MDETGGHHDKQNNPDTEILCQLHAEFKKKKTKLKEMKIKWCQRLG